MDVKEVTKHVKGLSTGELGKMALRLVGEILNAAQRLTIRVSTEEELSSDLHRLSYAVHNIPDLLDELGERGTLKFPKDCELVSEVVQGYMELTRVKRKYGLVTGSKLLLHKEGSY